MPNARAENSVAKIVEITSQSTSSFQDAIDRGIERASRTIKDIRGAWVQDQELVCDNGEIAAYRVVMKVTFVLEEE
ncbi:dodecin family protein [Nannocystis pusilla]|uniref:Dodecin family protein n=1 Tax=Nannocystis pusilla TaxID=889268 RepID=A0ABS7TUL5_9BACT|nr:dodecin family protein [Nannocystis pusilla]MBZ5711928.1 dodecin family protein [Nannocystis pusilla]